MRKNFECERDRWVGLWKKDPTNDCTAQKDMKLHRAVQEFSGQLMEDYGVNLRFVSSEAIHPYLQLRHKLKEDAEFKRKVLAIVVKVIKEDKNPFTHAPFGRFGLTEGLMRDIIIFARTNAAPTREKQLKTPLTTRDIDLLDVVFQRGIAGSKTEGEKDQIIALRKKFDSIRWR